MPKSLIPFLPLDRRHSNLHDLLINSNKYLFAIKLRCRLAFFLFQDGADQRLDLNLCYFDESLTWIFWYTLWLAALLFNFPIIDVSMLRDHTKHKTDFDVSSHNEKSRLTSALSRIFSTTEYLINELDDDSTFVFGLQFWRQMCTKNYVTFLDIPIRWGYHELSRVTSS